MTDNELFHSLSELPQRVAMLEERSDNQGKQIAQLVQSVNDLRNDVTNHLMHRVPYGLMALISVLTGALGVIATLLSARW